MTNTDWAAVARVLQTLINSRRELQAAVKRKRSLRDSERAMSLANIEKQITALALAHDLCLLQTAKTTKLGDLTDAEIIKSHTP